MNSGYTIKRKSGWMDISVGPTRDGVSRRLAEYQSHGHCLDGEVVRVKLVEVEPLPDELLPPKFPKLDIRDGIIHYKIYRQDGTFQPMAAEDTPDNRQFIDWVQQHDRYTVGEKAV